jgi:hypothetical protein
LNQIDIKGNIAFDVKQVEFNVVNIKEECCGSGVSDVEQMRYI